MWQRIWWPLSCRLNKKFSFKATARPGQPFVKGDRRVPLQTRGHTQCVGRVSLGVPYLHSDSLRVWDRREPMCRVLSLLFLPSLSFFLSLSLAYFRVSFSPSPLEYWCGQAPGLLWDPSSDPSQSGHRMTILLWKSETLGWIEPLCNPRGAKRGRRDGTRPLACPECLPSLTKCSSELKKRKEK